MVNDFHRLRIKLLVKKLINKDCRMLENAFEELAVQLEKQEIEVYQ